MKKGCSRNCPVCNNCQRTELKFSKARMTGKHLKLVGQRPTKKDLDDLCREVVFQRDGYKCQMCGRTKEQGWQLQWTHFITRANYAVRWDLDNSICACAKCHNMGNDSAHHNPADFADWWCGRLGNADYQKLRLRAATVKQTDRWGVKLYLLAERKKIINDQSK